MIKYIKYFDYNDNNDNIYTNFYKYQLCFLLNIIKHIQNDINVYSLKTFNYPISYNNNPTEQIENVMMEELENDNNDSLYIFNSIDYYFLTMNATKYNINIFNKFIKHVKYIFFHYEVYINTNLEQIGYLNYNDNLIPDGLISDNRKDFICNFYKNAKYVILQSYKNIEYLKENYDCFNVIYFPCLGYSEINKFIPIKKNNNKNIDLLFYGTTDINTPYRNNIIEKLKTFSIINNINFIHCKNLNGIEKDNVLSNTKIVIHLPIKYDSKIAPAWCKIMELMCKKIFFIIEENDEIYKSNLQETIIFYKHNNFNDLTDKILYYLNSDTKINDIIEDCYKLVKEKYNMDNFVKNLISNIN